MKTKSELLTVRRAAERAGVKRQSIYKAIDDGRLHGECISGVWFVRVDDLERYAPAAPRPGAGRPAKTSLPVGG